MSEEKLDLRIERTYRLLSDAFGRMLASRHYEDITVSDLCDEAMIRRTTFYKHFADKDEFFAFYVRRIHGEFEARCALPGGYESVLECNRRMTREFMRFLRENQGLAQMCLTSAAFSVLDEMIYGEISRSLTTTLREQEARGEVFCAPAEDLACYMASGFLRSLYKLAAAHPGLEDDECARFEAQTDVISRRLLSPIGEQG